MVISISGIKLVESDTYPLATFSQNMICHHFSDCPFNEHLKDIEINLGIQPNHYNHLFEIAVVKEATSGFYNPVALDNILKGEHAPVVDAFRGVLKTLFLSGL